MNDEISRLFPDFSNQSAQVLAFNKLKRYALLLCGVYSQKNVSEEDKERLRHEKNLLVTKDKAKRLNEVGIEIERNFLQLLSFLELSQDVSVLEFYGKLDYIHKRNKAELSAQK